MLEFLPRVELRGKDFAGHAFQHKLQIRHKRQGNGTLLDYESVQRVLLLPAIDDACYCGTDGWGRIRTFPCHRIGLVVGIVSEGKDIAITAHICTYGAGHGQTELFAPQKNFGGSEGTSGEEDKLFCMHPHKFLFENSTERTPVRSMPGKKHNVAISLWSLFDEPNFAFTKTMNDNSGFIIKREK
jgi:hypothetical protein